MLAGVKDHIIYRIMDRSFHTLFPLKLKVVEIETTTICNRKCSYCPNFDHARPNAYMSEDIFRKIIGSLKEMGFKGRVSPHFYGEPLMDKRLGSLLRYAKNELPDISIKLFTNGDLLTTQRYLALKKAGVDTFRISQHSERPTELTMKTLSEIKAKHPELYTVEYIDYAHDEAIKMNRGGLVDVEVRRAYRCDYVDQMTFDHLGNAVLCCNDYHSSVIFGNIETRSVSDIWWDKEYVKMRNLIRNGSWPYEICKICANA